jgi:uncharacterized protein
MPNETSGRVRSSDGGPKELLKKSPLLLHCEFQSIIPNGLSPISRAGAVRHQHRGRARLGYGKRRYVRLCLDNHTRRNLMPLDDKTRTELEAAVLRRLIEHLRNRTDVQNIDLMNLAGFCRNCLSNWMKDAADNKGIALSKDESREAIYGMPYEEWKQKYQREASSEQQATFDKASQRH